MPRVKKETVKKSPAVRLPSTAKKAEAKSDLAEVRSRKTDSLSVPVYSLAGKESGTMVLPKEIFGQKVNKALLAQAMRVYTTNQKTFTGSTKTRGEVEGSTAKIYRQKGTGRARHGAIRAPIFVGGGIVFGPHPRTVRLDLSQNMKKAALLSAFSVKAADKEIVGVSGIEGASGKTKEMVKMLSSVFSLQSSEKKPKIGSALIVTDGKQDNVVKAVRNIQGMDVLSVNYINAFEVLRHELLLLTKEAVEKFTKVEVVKEVSKEEKPARQARKEGKRIVKK